MANDKVPKISLRHNFLMSQRLSVDRETNRMHIVLPQGWRFNSLTTNEGHVRLTFKRVTATRKTGRATGYARDRQRLMRG